MLSTPLVRGARLCGWLALKHARKFVHNVSAATLTPRRVCYKIVSMSGNCNKKSNGFTIIEIALVLAVAALIFLVIFLAVPALQRNQRDNARKRDMTLAAEILINYQANTGRQLPPLPLIGGTPYTRCDDGKFRNTCGYEGGNDSFPSYLNDLQTFDKVTIYLDGGFATEQYSYAYLASTFFPNPESWRWSNDPNWATLLILFGTKCDSANKRIVTDLKQHFALITYLENGGVYCQDA
jgi:type II secretory pathway pseudopilin PulG